MMLADEDFLGRIREVISGEKVNAAYAVTVARDEYAALFPKWTMPTCKSGRRISWIFPHV